MTLINIRNLGVTLNAPLFYRLDLSINAGDRIGLVAANGRGKSTLLRCIAGMVEPSDGEITRSHGLTIGYVEQDVPSGLADTPFHAAVLDMLPVERRASEAWRVDVALESLDVPEALRERPLKQLSGGWQRFAMLARIVVAEADVLLLDEPTNHLERSAGTIKLANRETHAKVLITLDDAAVAAPDGRLLFKTGKQFICKEDRIVLLGPNGAGKTRFVAMLRQAIENPQITQAGIKVSQSLALGFCEQNLADLSDADTPMHVLTRRFEVGDQRARALLAGSGLSVAMQSRPIGRLSGGQKARLGMLLLRLAQPNFYLLDEPTNHLDIEGQEALEDLLLEHQASCLLVSHDRNFVRAVGSRFWLIERKKLVELEGPEGFFASIATG